SGGTDAIVVNDLNNANPDSFTLTSSSVGRTNSATITIGASVENRTVNAGSANNIVTVASLPTSGSLAFNGGLGSDTLAGPNTANTFDITGANLGRLGLLSFSSVENLRGNLQADTFRFGTAGSLSGTVDGSRGADTLDFTVRVSPVSVNLLTGTATS